MSKTPLKIGPSTAGDYTGQIHELAREEGWTDDYLLDYVLETIASNWSATLPLLLEALKKKQKPFAVVSTSRGGGIMFRADSYEACRGWIEGYVDGNERGAARADYKIEQRS